MRAARRAQTIGTAVDRASASPMLTRTRARAVHDPTRSPRALALQYSGHAERLAQWRADDSTIAYPTTGGPMRRPNWIPAAASFMAAALCAAALWAPQAAANPVAEAIGKRVETLQFIANPAIRGAPIAAHALLAEVYASRQFQPLWTRTERIQEFLALIRRAPEHGLSPEDYFETPLRALLAEQATNPSARITADVDILLTAALARYGYHQIFGKVNPASFDANINFRRTFLNDRGPVAAIEAVVEAEVPLARLIDEAVVRGPIYRAVQQQLADYRALMAAGGWPQVPSGALLREGDQDPRVSVLRERLAVTGDLPAGSDLESNVFDAEVHAAIITFQERHGIDVDGIVGPQTREALNVPVAQRVNQLRLTLERLRWVQQEVGEIYVVVNIADFKAFVMRGREVVWRTRVMVGKEYRQTPVFRGDIQYMEINPTWTVPPGILRNTVLPAIKSDVDYLADNNMAVLDRDGNAVDPTTVDWQAYSRGVPYIIRQRPGPDNALGRIKFIFPNQHFVFLHDTPSRALFDRPERAFSSGCVRVEKPFDLAALLAEIDGQTHWSRAAFDDALASAKTQRVYFATPIPVVITYLTAGAGPGEPVRFVKDIYGRDDRLLKVLDGPVVIELPGPVST